MLKKALSGFPSEFYSYTLANNKIEFFFSSRITCRCTCSLSFSLESGQGLEKPKTGKIQTEYWFGATPHSVIVFACLHLPAVLLGVCSPAVPWLGGEGFCGVLVLYSPEVTLKHGISLCQAILLGASPDELCLESSWEGVWKWGRALMALLPIRVRVI